MSKLEDLVPPINLCRMIPKGEFGDSVLVWHEMSTPAWDMHALVSRDAVDGFGFAFPAPTLEEIMRYTGRRFDVQFEDEWWFAESGSNAFSGATATIAALNLLFEVRGWQG